MICEVHGKKFKSITKVLEYYNISNTIFYKLKRSYPEKSVEEIVNEYNSKYRFQIEDKQFKSVKEMCNYYGINESSFYTFNSKNQNKSILENFKDFLSRYKIKVGDRFFKSYSEIARYYGFNPESFNRYRRRHKDKSIEELIDLYRVIDNNIIRIDGLYFKSIISACKFYKISPTTFYKYRKLYTDLTDSQIIQKCREKSKHKITENIIIDNNIFTSVQSACKYYKISYYMYQRFKDYYCDDSPTEIIKRLIVAKNNKELEIMNHKCLTVYNKKFNNLQEVLQAYSIPVKSFYRLRNNNPNTSLEDLIDMYKKNSKKRYTYIVHGKIFRSKKEIANFYNLTYHKYLKFLNTNKVTEENIEDLTDKFLKDEV